MFDIAGLNYLAILTATLLGFLIGGLWYGPLFGRSWLAAVGKTEEDLQGGAMPFVVSFVSAFATAFLLACLVDALDATTAAEGLQLGLCVGVGFIAAAMASDYAFCGWSMRLFLIQAGYRVVYSLVMGAVLAVWR